MDIDTALENMRAQALEIIETASESTLAGELAETVLAIDEWLCKVGYLPADWAYGRA